MEVNGLLYAARTSMKGLSVQVKRMELISENIANVDKSPDGNGRVYQRQVLRTQLDQPRRSKGFAEVMDLQLTKSSKAHLSGTPGLVNNPEVPQPYQVEEIPGQRLVYDPHHPQANEEGYVAMPEVNLVEEMVDLVSTSRMYEANVSVLTAAKQMAKRALDI